MENYVVSQHEEESLSVILMSTKNTSTYLGHSRDANPLGKTSQDSNAFALLYIPRCDQMTQFDWIW